MPEVEVDQVETIDVEPDTPTMDQALEGIDALLAGEPEPIPEKEEVAETPELEEVEELEAEPEQISVDYDLEVPMPDGRDTMTLGALKDKVVELERTDQQLIERENDLMRRGDELALALQQAGGEIPVELKKQMAERQTQHLEREHKAMLEAIPEWSDKQAFEKDRTMIADVAKSYGFSPDEISGIMDHRVVKFMRDHGRLLAAQARGRENVEQLKSKALPKGRRAAPKTKQSKLDRQFNEAVNSNNASLKDDAIKALLGV